MGWLVGAGVCMNNNCVKGNVKPGQTSLFPVELMSLSQAEQGFPPQQCAITECLRRRLKSDPENLQEKNCRRGCKKCPGFVLVKLNTTQEKTNKLDPRVIVQLIARPATVPINQLELASTNLG